MSVEYVRVDWKEVIRLRAENERLVAENERMKAALSIFLGHDELVARLRAPHYWMSGSDEGHEGYNDTPREAADAIEQLQAQLAERSRDETVGAVEKEGEQEWPTQS